MQILLVVEDDVFATQVKVGLEEKGFCVTLVTQGLLGHAHVIAGCYQLIMVDIEVSEQSGVSVCQLLRKQGLQTPILLFSDLDHVEDCIVGLDLGVNDYLLKPFDLPELVARIRVLLSRKGSPHAFYLRAEDLVLDPVTRKVKRGEREVDLTPREFSLLEYMMRHQGRVLSRKILRDHVWHYNFDTGTNVIDVYVNYLRQKLSDDTHLPLIQTVRGVGYVFQPGGGV
ncbi:MAG: response regulator transcription factor [Candidatus Latescibacterota bacterium]